MTKKSVNKNGKVFWFTGLSGAGKTTLADLVAKRFRMRGEVVVLLDGDELRPVFNFSTGSSTNHTPKQRLALGKQYGRLCKMIAEQGVTVVIATISLFNEVHKWNRANLPNYFEVYIKVPLNELRRRDPKGIYQKFDAGALTNY